MMITGWGRMVPTEHNDIEDEYPVIIGVGPTSVLDHVGMSYTQRFQMCMAEVGRVDLAHAVRANRVGAPKIGLLMMTYPEDWDVIWMGYHLIYRAHPNAIHDKDEFLRLWKETSMFK